MHSLHGNFKYLTIHKRVYIWNGFVFRSYTEVCKECYFGGGIPEIHNIEDGTVIYSSNRIGKFFIVFLKQTVTC